MADLLGQRAQLNKPGTDPASGRAHRDRLRVLLKTWPDAQAVCIQGRSLLFHAIEAGNNWAVADLLRAGARPLPGEPFLRSVLTHIPQHWKRAFKVRVGLEEGSSRSEPLLHTAIRCPKPTAVADLLRAGVSPHAPDEKGISPLHATFSVALEPALRMRQDLTAAGADWFAPDPEGWTAFQRVLGLSARGFPVEQMLPPALLPLPDANAHDPEGVLPLSRVLRAHQKAVPEPAKGVVLWGAPKSPSGWLHWLVAQGARWNAVNADGTTPRSDFEQLHARMGAVPAAPGTKLEEADRDMAFWKTAIDLDASLPYSPSASFCRPRM